MVLLFINKTDDKVGLRKMLYTTIDIKRNGFS